MKKAILFILVLLIVNLAACTKGNKIPEDDAIKAPVIRLSDSLSSQLNEFTVQSGNYSLKYMVDKEMRGVTACGSHPLDKSQEKNEKLRIPKYNGMDYAAYLLTCDREPDRVTVAEWDLTQSGDMDAKAVSETVYEDGFLLELKPGKIYEITAEWKEENMEVNGFYGEASYALRTE